MRLWRISNHSDLKGMGGERTDGRWHTASRGKRIVYLSEHPALALIETLVNLKGNPHLFPERYQLLRLDVPENISMEELDPASLPEAWEQDIQATRQQGDAWLKSRHSPLLAVPSAAAPISTNYLLNPTHPEAGKLSVAWTRWVRYDERLFHAYTDK